MGNKTIYILFIFCLSLLGFVPDNGLLHIPSRKINLSGQWWNDKTKLTATLEDFEVSHLVTYAEYKIYLKEIKTDSSSSFYQSQLPDTTMCKEDVYDKYVNSKEYDSYPVLGIRWEAAMNFCKWKTLKENKGAVSYMYCLPTYSQWVAAYEYLKSVGNAEDFNDYYSDWTLTPMDESEFNIKDEVDSIQRALGGEIMYSHADARVLRRKMILGNSYLFLLNYSANTYYHYYGYSDNGYRQVGFRYVKHKIISPDKYKGTTYIIGKYDARILRYWGIKIAQ